MIVCNIQFVLFYLPAMSRSHSSLKECRLRTHSSNLIDSFKSILNYTHAYHPNHIPTVVQSVFASPAQLCLTTLPDQYLRFQLYFLNRASPWKRSSYSNEPASGGSGSSKFRKFGRFEQHFDLVVVRHHRESRIGSYGGHVFFAQWTQPVLSVHRFVSLRWSGNLCCRHQQIITGHDLHVRRLFESVFGWFGRLLAIDRCDVWSICGLSNSDRCRCHRSWSVHFFQRTKDEILAGIHLDVTMVVLFVNDRFVVCGDWWRSQSRPST